MSEPEELFAENYPELLEALGAAVADTLMSKGIHVTVARACARAAAERVHRDFGGHQYYLSSAKSYRCSLRDNEIYDKWKPGVNESELIREYGIVERHLRRIIEARREDDRVKRQGSLL